MKKALAIICLVLVSMLAIVIHRNKEHRTEIERLSTNEKTLLTEVREYKVADSLSAAEVGVLSLTLEQYKQYRKEDAQLIKDLKHRNHELQNVSKAQTEAIIDLQGKVRDTIINVTDTMYCIEIKNRWFELSGCADADMNWKGRLKYRDELMIYEQVQYKRFLGFLWKTNKIKQRNIQVVSKNPYTQHIDFEYIEIE